MTFRTLTTVSLVALMGSMAAADEVRVYNWSDYIDEDLLGKFEEETGIKLIYDVFDSNELLETKMLAGGSGYDVVVPSGTFLQRQISAGAFQKLDVSKIANHGNLWDVIQARTEQYDPGGQYSVNYMWGTTGVGYNIGKVTEILGEDAPLDSWDLVFDPANMEKLAECGVHFLDAPAEMIPAALNYIGEDPDSHDPEVIAKAEAVFAGIRPYIQKFHSSEYINALANGDICVAVGWSGDVFQAQYSAAEAENGNEIDYSIPVQGAQMWFDQMAIPADAPNPDAAHAFINFILDAQNSAAATNYVWYASGNKAAQEFIDQEILDYPAVYPTEDTLKNLYTTTPYPAKVQRVVTRMWTKIKSGT